MCLFVTMLPPKDNIPMSQPAEQSVRLDMDRIRSSIPRIAPVFRNTPQYICPALGAALDCEIVLKLETANRIRCFKGRGTETVMARLSDSSDFKAAICASAGNLGQALAYSGQRRGISTTGCRQRRESIQTGAYTRIGRDPSHCRRRYRGCSRFSSADRRE
jgi:hypothetical protein